MERFLKAKHWQIFILICVLPYLLQMILMTNSVKGADPLLMLKNMPIALFVFIFGFFGWFWAIAIGLQKKIPLEVKMKVKIFKTFIVIPLIYMVLIFGLMELAFDSTTINNQESGVGQNGELIGIIVPLHLFSMFCIFYCLYFVAKTFKTVELQRTVTFSDFAGEFFLFWFFPIGIWIVQPKINKMILD